MESLATVSDNAKDRGCTCHQYSELVTLPQRFIRRSVSSVQVPDLRKQSEKTLIRKHSLGDRRQLFRPHSASLPHIHVNDATECLYRKPPSGLLSKQGGQSSAPSSSKLQEPVFRIGGKTGGGHFTIQHEGERIFYSIGLHDDERARSSPLTPTGLDNNFNTFKSCSRRRKITSPLCKNSFTLASGSPRDKLSPVREYIPSGISSPSPTSSVDSSSCSSTPTNTDMVGHVQLFLLQWSL